MAQESQGMHMYIKVLYIKVLFILLDSSEESARMDSAWMDRVFHGKSVTMVTASTTTIWITDSVKESILSIFAPPSAQFYSGPAARIILGIII